MKEKRTAEQLSELVLQEVNIEGLWVVVLSDKIYGWNAFPRAMPENEPDIHYKFQIAVESLRKRFELADAPAQPAG